MKNLIIIIMLLVIGIGGFNCAYKYGKMTREMQIIKEQVIVNNTGTYYLVRIDDNTDQALADLESFRLDMAEGNQE